ncbi:MAG TPA: exopolysaccharide biosynthesis polyprenyl glycosylphosphotransferase [Myxococcales bacterium]|jgi:lipopolysaccharide/colanic/teichoic acid biosynthesis glycosyltransferase|nr:exopolysaccharide biosynthesis polyprenyl glycosylphosphotransferase [Myxococcales bacterium]
MAQFAGHWYSGRAARLCALEGALVVVALWVTGREAHEWRALAALIAAAACVPAALYLADLYDPQVMRNDRSRGAKALKALGFSALSAAIFGVLGGAGLPKGALLTTMGVASLGVLLARAALIARSDEDGHSRVLILGAGKRALEVARLIRTEAYGEYEVAATLDPSIDLARPATDADQAVQQAAGASLVVGPTQGSILLPAGASNEEPEGSIALSPVPVVVQASQLMVAPEPGDRLDEGGIGAVNVDRAVGGSGAATGAGAGAGTVAQRGHAFPALASVVQLPSQAHTVVVPARSLAQAVTQLRADTVVIASDEQRGQVPVDELIHLRLSGVTVLPAHSFAERVLRRVPISLLRPSDLAVGHRLNSPLHSAGKRLLDLLLSAAMLLVALPVLAVLAVLIKLDSAGPVFYRQERVGRQGKPYTIYKLRTMREDAEQLSGPVWASQRDPRVTRLGAFLRKTRLDELPQVIAVLRGDMSFVGPRPERPFFVEQLKAQIPFFGLREAVKPGITGWAQIRYPYGATVEDARNKLEYDLYYVQHQSLFLDLAIAFHTAKTVLFGRGAR